MHYGCIYKVTNIENNKCYIGKTIFSIDKRKNQHLKNAELGVKSLFYYALRKYGFHKFKWEVLGYCNSLEELNEAEIACIEFFQSKNYIYGYNLTNGGDGSIGFKWSKESIQQRELTKKKNGTNKQTEESNNKRRKAMLGRPSKLRGVKRPVEVINKMIENNVSWNRGLTKETDERIKLASKKTSETLSKKILSEEDIEKRRETGRKNKGRKLPPQSIETREKRKQNAKNNKNYGMGGKKHTELGKKHMSENHWDCSGKNNPSYKHIPISQLFLLYSSGVKIKELSKYYNMNPTAIRDRLNNSEKYM